jgi:hypothetical protein
MIAVNDIATSKGKITVMEYSGTGGEGDAVGVVAVSPFVMLIVSWLQSL